MENSVNGRIGFYRLVSHTTYEAMGRLGKFVFNSEVPENFWKLDGAVFLTGRMEPRSDPQELKNRFHPEK
jgi:hypothetical protein